MGEQAMTDDLIKRLVYVRDLCAELDRRLAALEKK